MSLYNVAKLRVLLKISEFNTGDKHADAAANAWNSQAELNAIKQHSGINSQKPLKSNTAKPELDWESYNYKRGIPIKDEKNSYYKEGSPGGLSYDVFGDRRNFKIKNHKGIPDIHVEQDKETNSIGGISPHTGEIVLGGKAWKDPNFRARRGDVKDFDFEQTLDTLLHEIGGHYAQSLGLSDKEEQWVTKYLYNYYNYLQYDLDGLMSTNLKVPLLEIDASLRQRLPSGFYLRSLNDEQKEKYDPLINEAWEEYNKNK
jgi:hypothetical protein